MRVPELARLPETVEPSAALAEAVEVLLALEREARPHARRAVGAALDGHAGVGGLAQQPRAGGVGEGQAHGLRLDASRRSLVASRTTSPSVISSGGGAQVRGTTNEVLRRPAGAEGSRARSAGCRR